MPVIHAPESEYAKERTKWEAFPTEMGPGRRPYQFQRFPMMMHKAGPPASGAGAITIIDTEQADDEQRAMNLKSRGFRETPLDAIEAYEADALERAKLSAEIEYDLKHKLSPKAVAEVRAAQDEVSGHLASVPETPVKPRRRGKAKE